MKITDRFIYLVGLLALCASGNAQAGTVVYDNLGSGGSVYQDGGGGWDALGASSPSSCQNVCGDPAFSAFSFTPGVTSYFTELELGLGYVSGSNSVMVVLMSDLSNSPGAVLESWNAPGLPSDLTCCTLQTLVGDGTIPLLAGATYWVSVQPGSADTFALWQYNSSGTRGIGFVNLGTGWFNNGSDDVIGAFEVQGSQQAVPEPSTALTLAAGILLVGKLKGSRNAKRRRLLGARVCRISN